MPHHLYGHRGLRRFSYRGILILFGIACSSSPGFAQKQLSEAEFVKAVLSNPVNTQASELDLRQQQQLLKASADIDRLRISIATDPYDPTEIAIEQDIAFPSVYVRRHALQRARIHYAEASLSLKRYDVTRRASELYAQLQWLAGRSEALRVQDSLFEKISSAASRSFDAGQVDALENQFAANRYGNVHNLYLRAAEQAKSAQAQAGILAGMNSEIIPQPAAVSKDSKQDTTTTPYPGLALLDQDVSRSRTELNLQRSEAWPGFSAGLGFGLGDEVRQRPFGIQAGLTLPIYFWQTSARIAAAKTGLKGAEARQQDGLQDWKLQTAAAEATLQRAQAGIRYYQSAALPRADEIISTAYRLFAAGQISYSDYLRNAAEAFDNRISWHQALYDYQLALINLRYLKGTL